MVAVSPIEELHLSPRQVCAVSSELSTLQRSSINDAPGIHAASRRDGYVVPSRRVDTTCAPLSVLTTDPFYGKQHATTDPFYGKQHATLDGTTHVERLSHRDTNGMPTEFPVLLGNVSPYSGADESKFSNLVDNKSAHSSAFSVAPNFASHSRMSATSGTSPIIASSHHQLPCSFNSFRCPTPMAWGSLPLGPLHDPGNVPFNAAANNNRRSPVPPPMTLQSSCQLDPGKFASSFPVPQCPMLSGHAPALSEYPAGTSSHPPPSGYYYNFPEASGWYYPSGPYHYDDGVWVETEPGAYQYYPRNLYDGSSLVPGFYPIATTQDKLSRGKALWAPSSSHQEHKPQSTSGNIREIESRVISDPGRGHLQKRDWGQPEPSQEQRKAKKWWTLCSSV